ncbi:hypothetical protein D3C76_1421400 [compost metagenome]
MVAHDDTASLVYQLIHFFVDAPCIEPTISQIAEDHQLLGIWINVVKKFEELFTVAVDIGDGISDFHCPFSLLNGETPPKRGRG